MYGEIVTGPYPGVSREKRVQDNPIWTMAIWIPCLLLAFGVCIYFSMQKTVVITDVSSIGTDAPVVMTTSNSQKGTAFEVTVENGESYSIRIPLSASTRAENSRVENRYCDEQLVIHLYGAEAGYYIKHPIKADTGVCLAAVADQQENETHLILQMDGVWEYRTVMEGTDLVVTMENPSELYDKKVVIDPLWYSELAATGTEDVVLETVRQLDELWDMERVKIYITRSEGTEVSAQKRLELLQNVNPDLWISVGIRTDRDASLYGIEADYNALYFSPDYSNSSFADTLVRNVSIQSSNRGRGVTAAAEDSILRSIEVPAAQINIGYLSNPGEKLLLEEAAYRKEIAEGICDAIAEAIKALDAVD